MTKHLTHLCLLCLVVACGGEATKPAKTTPTPPIATAPAEPATVDQIMEASIAAQGGREALAKLSSLKITGTMEISGIKGTMVTLTAPARESMTTIDLQGLGKLVSGVHGDLAWEASAMTGARVLTGSELATTLRDATFNGDLVWKQLFPKAELVGVVDFAGTKAWKLVLTDASGEAETRYIAKDTKLPLGVEMVANTQMGKVPVTVTTTDYRDVGGLKFPFKIHNESAQAFTITVTSVEPNSPVDPKTFEPSDEIKQLAAKTK